MNDDLRRILYKQRYRLAGEHEHSGVKLCHWMRQKLLHDRRCYKEQFYGIPTHRCLQMSPTVNHCTQKCLFCWRFQDFSETAIAAADEPEAILDGLIAGQRELVSGYKGDERCDTQLWEEAQDPTQVAISLTGEPTLYPHLGAFIRLCHRRKMTTFLVTNGTSPDVLASLDPLPTQLYISVDAPTPAIYRKLCVPLLPRSHGWDQLMETLELLPSLDTRTVIRHTLVEGYNIGYEAKYARLDEMAEPLIVEPKAYVYVGYSRLRMTIENMPSFERVRSFASTLGEMLGYEIADERADSRVVALTEHPERLRIPGL